MKKTIVLILLLMPMLCFAGALQEKQKAVIAKKNVATSANGWFGYTTVGTGFTVDNAYIQYIAKAAPTCTGTATVTKIAPYSVNSGDTTACKVTLYTDSSGPSSRVAAETEFTSLSSWTAGYHEFTPVSYSVTCGSTYWIAIQCNSNFDLYYTSGDDNSHCYESHTYANSFPATATPTCNYLTRAGQSYWEQ
jgi:hypothetical protein